METYHNTYLRPPPPPPPPQYQSSDPNRYPQSNHQQAGQPTPLPPQNAWFQNQFQYQPPPPHISPTPPQSQPRNWAPPVPVAPADHLGPPPPYPTSFSYCSPFPPPNLQVPHHYRLPNQEWSNSNWGNHQVWNYSGSHSNAEDWAAKARAWAAAKKVEDQQPQAHFHQSSNLEGHAQFHGQHIKQEIQQQAGAVGPPLHMPSAYPGEITQFNSFTSSYSSSEQHSQQFESGNAARLSTINSSVNEQEVPSSYSSATVVGNYENKDQVYCASGNEEKQSALRMTTPPFVTPVLPDNATYGNQTTGPGTGPKEHPCSFVQSYHEQSGTIRGSAPIVPVPSFGPWTTNAPPGTHHPPMPPVHSSVLQHDPNIVLPSTIIGNGTPSYASFPSVPPFQPAAPSVTPYSIALGPGFPPATSFSGDAYGVSNVSDRTKKASVPNWLKEEIIKNASNITRSSLDRPKVDASTNDNEDEKSIGRGELDTRSLDSIQSTEEEEEYDEDSEEAAKTASINQEIKRILTEVLLKVTDELFDEIATKVLDEDDSLAESRGPADQDKHLTSSTSPVALSVKTDPNLIVASEAKGTFESAVTDTSVSGVHENLLGLANYSSGEDDYDDASAVTSSKRGNINPEVCDAKVSEHVTTASDNEISYAEHVKELSTSSDHALQHERANGSFDDRENSDANVRGTVGDRKDYEKNNLVYEERNDVDGMQCKRGEEGEKIKEKIKEVDYKPVHQDVKEGRSERLLRANANNESRKSRDKRHEDDRNRHKYANESSQYKRRRSPSTSDRRRNRREFEKSDDESSDDSMRGEAVRKRHSSPSSIRSRGRHASRSPNSKHSYRRHSPYSSLKSTSAHKVKTRSPSKRHR